jgi:hypothetical protein
MWLVNWLAARASKVLYLFGGFYSKLKSYINNFFSWLRYYRDQAYKWAKDYAYPKILAYYYQARDYVILKYNSAISWINHQYHVVRNFVIIEKIKLQNLIGYKVEKLGAEDRHLMTQIIKGDNALKTFLKDWINRVIYKVFHPFEWILVYKNLLKDLKELFSEENFKKLISLLTEGFAPIYEFATNPLEHIIAYLKPIILELLNYSLAYALGTEKYELPAWPKWADVGTGGDGGFLPHGVGRDLNSPLKSLRISGYTFNNPPGHMGIDLALSYGQSVYAMHSGIVEYVSRAMTGYGHQLTIGGGFWWTRSAHLMDIFVKPGQAVKKGQKIGRGDTTGNSTGNHLHLEIKYKGSFVDPQKILF